MLMVVNPPLGRFNRWMSLALAKLQGGSRLVLGAVLGALMATDYGGPINKAAYVTGTLAVTNSQYDIMAAVMAGGMIPPLGLALACLLFPDAVHQGRAPHRAAEPCDGRVLCDRGCAALALRDPLRSYSCMAGSALAGFLTVLFGCGCPAPHGGLFLLAVIGNRWAFGCPGGWQSADHIVGRYAEEACEIVNFRFFVPAAEYPLSTPAVRCVQRGLFYTMNICVKKRRPLPPWNRSRRFTGGTAGYF